MTSFDPYLVLGLARSANAAAIKTAYRQQVQVTHPDRGGDTETFIAIVKAFGVLSDPEARRLYDEAGIIDDDGIKSYRREVATILADMFDTAVSTAVASRLDLARVDFVGQLTLAVQTGLGDARGELAQTDREIVSLSGLRSRIRRNDAQQNLFAERLDGQVKAKTERHANIKRRVAILETALVELGNYASEVELIAALDAAQ